MVKEERFVCPYKVYDREDELAPQDAELMRSKYCIRFELGLCPVHQGAPDSGPLFLVNNGRRFPLGFDCRRCEMVVYNSSSTRSTSPK